nr:MAG TPA: hypothetical protein [Caudoviricetes sp.]
MLVYKLFAIANDLRSKSYQGLFIKTIKSK